MNKKQVEAIREQLLRNKQLLLEVTKTSETATETVELDQTRQGRLSRMDALQGQAMSIAASNRRKAELKNIELALKRIDNGGYGFCQHCDEEISLKRLEFNPTVSYCIHCAEKLEAEKQNPE
jgi:DnaK suppressor protein